HLEQIRRKTLCRYTVAHLPYREYLEQREAGMEKQEQEAQNDRRQEKIRQEKLHRIMEKVDHAQATISRQDPAGGRLLKKKMKAVKSMEKRFDREAEDMTRRPEAEEAIFVKFGENIRMPAGKVVLDFHLDRLTTGETGKWPDGERDREGAQNGSPGESPEAGKEVPEGAGRVLAEQVDLFVKGPAKVCITGRNGAGKTTLLRRIAAQLLAREDIHAAYMPQNYEELLDMSLTPVEYLCTTGEKEEVTRIRTYLGSMKYTTDEMSHPTAELSGGQKAKVFLLKMSLSGADVLILDEPTRNFSPLSNPVIRDVLRAYGGTIISISHDRKYIEEVCDAVYELTPKGLSRI
ncbi:MAG: ABC-F family ATP-binding cassette domain-containing protein, partial [Lachnospiraceae bacterium]|nr:ABC-F family ATP-binding cassette domain-containing protein [Lachnospiraceae bacterium]